MRNTIPIVAGVFLLVVFSAMIPASGKKIVYQIYDCPKCDNDGALFAEDSAKIHYCSGTTEKKHTRVVMVHKGKKTIETDK